MRMLHSYENCRLRFLRAATLGITSRCFRAPNGTASQQSLSDILWGSPMQTKLYLYVLAVLTAISSAYVGSTLANTGSPGHVPRLTSGQLARLVRDINTAPAGSDPANLTDVGGTLFFTAVTPETGRELWKSDGTAEGTVLVRDIFPGVESSAPANLTNVGGT